MNPSTDGWRRWLGVGLSGGLLLVGAVLPLPERRPRFGSLGPDKFLHLVGHAWLAAALASALRGDGGPTPRDTLLAVTLSTGYGVLIERLQASVPGRESERADVVAGVLGSLLGVAVRHRGLGRAPARVSTLCDVLSR